MNKSPAGKNAMRAEEHESAMPKALAFL